MTRQPPSLGKGLALLFAVSLTGCVSQDTVLPLEANARKEQRSALLGKHGFHRDPFDPGMLGLLAGNGEMGGLVALDGLGLDSIWCADLWEDRANRVPLEGLRVHLDGLDSGEAESHSQRQSLSDGTVVTEVQYAHGAGYRSRVFFSAKHRRLLAIQVENLSLDGALTGQIRLPEANYEYLAFTRLGHFERAKTMLEAHFKPAALRENAQLYVQETPGEEAPFSFAHEVRTDGTTNGVNDEQRHLNGFALALFHQYYVMTGDEEFLQESLYPVARGVAEFWSGLAVWNPSVEAYTFPKLRSVSEDLVEESILDVVLSARWSLETAVHYAERVDADEDARQRWAKVARELHVPQNDRHYLEFLGDREDREYGSYQGIRAPVYLGYPTSELASRLDAEKARKTLEHAWERNAHGKGMLGFIASWYALAAQRYGLGDLALEMAERNFDCYERSGTALCEGPNNLDRYYFLTTTAAYLLVPLHMLVQEQEGQIVPFPSVPEAWRDVAFHGVPAAGGRRVSGVMRDGTIVRARTTSVPGGASGWSSP